jgi:hypothetical protein
MEFFVAEPSSSGDAKPDSGRYRWQESAILAIRQKGKLFGSPARKIERHLAIELSEAVIGSKESRRRYCFE